MMTTLRSLALAALFLLGSPAVSAAVSCGEPCQRLIQEGQALGAKGKYKEAQEKYRAAQKADPQASLPVSMEANLLLVLSERVPEKTVQWRDAARALANQALAVAQDDPIAHEVLRSLDDNGPSPLHKPNPEAARFMAEAEAQFGQRHFKEALEQYNAAMKADPQYSGAWLGAADCYFAQRDWAQAEILFRRAVEIEPRNSQAWRYLADTLVNLGKFEAAEKALLSAIVADPSQRPNWIKLASIREQERMPLKPLALQRGVRVVAKENGGYEVQIDEPADKNFDTPDFAVRLMLGSSEVNTRSGNKAATPYETELTAWRQAMKVADELKASTGKELSDPALRQMQALARDGQLEPAILILMFRQSYRPALDAWLAVNPGGVKLFIDRYGLRP